MMLIISVLIFECHVTLILTVTFAIEVLFIVGQIPEKQLPYLWARVPQTPSVNYIPAASWGRAFRGTSLLTSYRHHIAISPAVPGGRLVGMSQALQ